MFDQHLATAFSDGWNIFEKFRLLNEEKVEIIKLSLEWLDNGTGQPKCRFVAENVFLVDIFSLWFDSMYLGITNQFSWMICFYHQSFKNYI